MCAWRHGRSRVRVRMRIRHDSRTDRAQCSEGDGGEQGGHRQEDTRLRAMGCVNVGV